MKGATLDENVPAGIWIDAVVIAGVEYTRLNSDVADSNVLAVYRMNRPFQGHPCGNALDQDIFAGIKFDGPGCQVMTGAKNASFKGCLVEAELIKSLPV